jgi:hypothetical protein
MAQGVAADASLSRSLTDSKHSIVHPNHFKPWNRARVNDRTCA